MTTALAPVRSQPLADLLVRRTLATDALFVVGGAVLTGVAAQLAVPLWPVPITGQTLAVLLVATSLGAVRGVLSMLLYALVGALGVPWFSDQTAGWSVLLGPSGGYIVGFILAAAVTGWLAQRQWDRRILGAILSFFAGSAAVFVIGLPWLAISLGLGGEKTLEFGLYPFIVGGILKALVAAGIIRSVWFAVQKNRT
jgi:biotin transport system substrate-specific component